MCWSSGTKVKMDNKTYKNIEDINPDDIVWTPNGYKKVRYLLTINFNDDNSIHPMCHYENKLLITPWHPISVDNKWYHPIHFIQPENIYMPVVYNMLLRDTHIIEVNGIQSPTLGHGIKGSIIEHSFFGDEEKIINSISKQPGFSTGMPVFHNLGIIRNYETNDVMGWFDNL
jgi:hypothetical protein